MRGWIGLALPALLLASGCRSEPSFNEAFNHHAAELEATANKMQSDLSNQMNAASAVHEGEGAALSDTAVGNAADAGNAGE